MSIQNFKTRTQIKMEAELEAWKNGDKEFSVATQFDESILESALKNFDTYPEKSWEHWFDRDQNPSEWDAGRDNLWDIIRDMSTFEAPEMAAGWYQ